MVQLYNGDLLPKRAWEMLSNDEHPRTFLIDVRTQAECHYVGTPDLRSLNVGSDQYIKLQWRLLDDMQINQNFAQELTHLITDKSANLIFLCRTGGRSMESAAFAKTLGYETCYNLLYGFEGDLDSKGQRGKLNGWKADLLPWRQD